MYDQVMHQGKMLTEWQKLFKNQYSLGELYRMAKEGADFFRMYEYEVGNITFES